MTEPGLTTQSGAGNAHSLNEALKKELEAMVMGGKYEYQSDFAKKHFAEGRQEGLRAALLTVIRARWGDEAAQRTEARLAAASLADLERWLAGAVTASTVDSLFSDA